jgi:hypothetical protein
LATKKIEEIKAQYLTYFVGIINRLFLIKKKEAIENIFDYSKYFSLYNDLEINEKGQTSKSIKSENNQNYNDNNNNQLILTKI